MSLKAIAKSHRVGAVVFYMLPHTNLAFNLALRWGREKWGDGAEAWPMEATAFIASMPALVEVEFDHDATESDLMLKAFWENRTHDLDTDWQLFLQCMSVDTINALDEAYDHTRRTPLQADASLQAVPDDEADDSQKKDDATNSNGSGESPKPTPKKTSKKKAAENSPVSS